MFPTVDVSVIEMVLESVGGSQERAIEHLLPMTDPEFKPDPASEANATVSGVKHQRIATTQCNVAVLFADPQAQSQLTMDEELARALYIHEQELATRPSARRSASSSDSASRIPAVLPYQARVRRPRPAQPDPYAQSTREHALSERYGDPPEGQGPGGDPPGMIAFEEKLGQFAEGE
jgi:hypothetical protein